MNNLLDTLKEILARYADIYLKLLRVTVIGKTATLVGYLLFALIGLFFLFCILMFAGFGLVELFVESGLSRMLSVFAVTGIYVLLLLLMLVLRKPVTRMFAGSVVRALSSDQKEED